jgi:Leucine Rich repeat
MRPMAKKYFLRGVLGQTVVFGCLFCSPGGQCKDAPANDLAGSGAPVKTLPNGAVINRDDVGGPSITLAFPKAYSAGSLYKLKAGRDGSDYLRISRTFFAPARGDVSVPRGLLLGLLVSYEGAEDMSSLDRLAPGVVVLLKFERLNVTDRQFKAIKCLPTLRGLELTDVDITDRGFMQVQNCRHIAFIALKSTVITGKGLVALRGLKSMKDLDCEQNLFDDASLDNLSGLTSLRHLSLRGCHITDAGLKHLLPLTELTGLTLSVNKITDAGIASLLPLKKIESLDITDTKVTAACLESLCQFPNLKNLLISEMDFTPAQIYGFKRRLPHCHIHDGKKTGVDLQFFSPLH